MGDGRIMLPPVYTDFKLGDCLGLGEERNHTIGEYSPISGEGVVYLHNNTFRDEWYETYEHETMHGILHRLEGGRTCHEMDYLFRLSFLVGKQRYVVTEPSIIAGYTMMTAELHKELFLHPLGPPELAPDEWPDPLQTRGLPPPEGEPIE